MYLLNLDVASEIESLLEFTFHYVSIKSQITEKYNRVMTYLHSTMYLLNRNNVNNITGTMQFTFHYVSIKSNDYMNMAERLKNLHSTMYLLNLYQEVHNPHHF